MFVSIDDDSPEIYLSFWRLLIIALPKLSDRRQSIARDLLHREKETANNA